MARLADRFGHRVSLSVFGADSGELARNHLILSPCIRNLGVLSQRQVGSTLRLADLFLDLSDYQAFGRTAVEAMACGCVPLVPVLGGAHEFARHDVNALICDTRSEEAILAAVSGFVVMAAEMKRAMRNAAIETALRYTVARSVFSMLRLFEEHLSRDGLPHVERAVA